jgi:N-acetylmuramoyl-L-alanine amidase
LIRAESEGDGKLGMLMVGNVGVSLVRAECLDFRDLTSLIKMIFQRPGGFEAAEKGYFYQDARQSDIVLAKKVTRGQRFHPAANSLWFSGSFGKCPGTWYNQPNTGRFKSHFFFSPTRANCPDVF